MSHILGTADVKLLMRMIGAVVILSGLLLWGSITKQDDLVEWLKYYAGLVLIIGGFTLVAMATF